MKKTGRIIKGTGGLFHVEDPSVGITAECRAKGTFRKDGIVPLVGDMVEIEPEEKGESLITAILPRKNALVRPAVSNVDLLIIVAAAAKPIPDLFMIDKLTAVASHNGIEVLLVINKSDIADTSELVSIYTLAGIKTIALSAMDTENCDVEKKEILSILSGKTTFFAGASGVGKTSLINLLFPDFHLVTGEISKKISRGKHTTRCTELYRIDENTYIGDTPGFSMLEVALYRLLPKDGLLASFPDIEKHSYTCRYKKCTHTCEDGCSVLAALEKGDIAATRHESYMQLFHELKQQNDWDK